MDKEGRKTEIYRILKNLYFLAEKDDWEKYFKIKEIYNNLIINIFGSKFKHGDEAWDWDNARNGLDMLYTLKRLRGKEKYEEEKKNQIVKALERIEKLKKYLT